MKKFIFSLLLLSSPAYAAKGVAEASISKSIFDMTYEEAVIYCLDGGNPNCDRVLEELKPSEDYETYDEYVEVNEIIIE
jgi:hypothetical protein